MVKEMKRILALFMTIACACMFAACGNTSNSGQNGAAEPVRPEGSPAEQNDSPTLEAGAVGDGEDETISGTGGKAIVVYFSASGNTERVAELVAGELGADLFELVPVEPYTDADLNWRDRNSRVCREHDDASLQDIELVSVEVPDWSAYDTVLFGYPLWWREAPWPVNSFIESNDFSGKTVIPFCTSTSNGLGESGKHLAEMAGSGNWIDGTRFSEHADEGSILNWVRGLGLE
jgi:flavodoxin